MLSQSHSSPKIYQSANRNTIGSRSLYSRKSINPSIFCINRAVILQAMQPAFPSCVACYSGITLLAPVDSVIAHRKSEQAEQVCVEQSLGTPPRARIESDYATRVASWFTAVQSLHKRLHNKNIDPVILFQRPPSRLNYCVSGVIPTNRRENMENQYCFVFCSFLFFPTGNIQRRTQPSMKHAFVELFAEFIGDFYSKINLSLLKIFFICYFFK